MITNAWAKKQTIQTDPGTSDFYGKIGGLLGAIYVYPSSTLNLRGTNSTFTTSLQSFGTIGLVKVGYDASEPSSMGLSGTLSLIPNDGTDYGRFVYLGKGETTVKTLAFNKWNSANAMTADGGVTGGLVWNGPVSVSDNHGVMNSVIFTGEHTNACTLGGSWTEPAGGTAYVTKKGSGTWIFRHHAARAMKGVVDVKEGRLQFESLAEKGTACSLGYATLTCSNVPRAMRITRRIGCPTRSFWAAAQRARRRWSASGAPPSRTRTRRRNARSSSRARDVSRRAASGRSP